MTSQSSTKTASRKSQRGLLNAYDDWFHPDDDYDDVQDSEEARSFAMRQSTPQHHPYRVLDALPRRERPRIDHEGKSGYTSPAAYVDRDLARRREDSIPSHDVESPASSPPGLMYDSDGDSESSEGPRSPSPRTSLPPNNAKGDKSPFETEVGTHEVLSRRLVH